MTPHASATHSRRILQVERALTFTNVNLVCSDCGAKQVIAKFLGPDHECNASTFVEAKERGND